MLSRLTFRGAFDGGPIWFLMGRASFFTGRLRAGIRHHLFQKLATGSENEESLFHSGPSFVFATDWSTDGGFIAVHDAGNANIVRSLDPAADR